MRFNPRTSRIFAQVVGRSSCALSASLSWRFSRTAGRRQLISANPEPDLIISDFHLGETAKGGEAIREVQREFDRQSQALIMTSDFDPGLHKKLETRRLRFWRGR